MVCKEEVFLWFQNLKGSKRIEAMCGFLNMCYPLELRFYGTCLEDLGRRDFYTFRDEEAKANNISEILKIRNIHEPSMRSKLIIVLSLLNSSNTLCAKELFRILSEEVKIEILASLRIFSDPKLVEHYMLLLTLAQHHPAFTFSQQTFLCNLSISLEKYAREINPRAKYECEETCLQPVFPCVGSVPVSSISERDVFNNSPQSYHRYPPPLQRRSSDSFQNIVRITSLKVKSPHKKQSIKIRVTWGNNKITDAFKTPKELLGFHQRLLELFPAEAKATNQEKFIPPFPQSIVAATQLNCLNENIISAVSEYIQLLNSRLPGYVLENDFVTSFFMPSSHTRAALAKSNRGPDGGQSDFPSRNPRLRSLTIYNSQMADNPAGHRPESRQKVSHSSVPRKLSENGSSCGRASPLTSPLQSPSSSPYASPISSETNSRAASPWSHIAGAFLERGACNPVPDPTAVDKVLNKDQMLDQWEVARNYKVEELRAMPIEELESLGILRDSTKIKKGIDQKSPPNGMIDPCLSKAPNPPKSGLLIHQPTSNDSSPVCSEYSSPPQSPSPAEACNQSSSGNEENVDKRSVKTLPDLIKIDESDPSQAVPDLNFKRTDDDIVALKSSLNRTTISVIPFPSHYSSIISQMPPPQNMKPAYLPIPCRTNSAPQHMSPGGVVFDNQFSRVPLPSALTFLQGPPRSHAVTPDRVLSTPSIPISTVSPFPVVTSGCATVPSATCCITTHKSSNVTAVTNSSASSNRHMQKNPSMRDSDIVKPVPQAGETAYAPAFMLSSTAQLTPASCSCFTTNSARPSPAPSPSMSPGATPQPSAVPVSLPYLGMHYVFHPTLSFLQPQAPTNGFVPQPGMANPGQSFSYALPNGLTAIPPELMYPGQTFALQSSSTQGNPGQVASPASQCYGAFSPTAPVQLKLSCFNCGKVGHRGTDCKEQTMDDLNKAGKFQLSYTPMPKIPDSHD